MTLEWRPGSTGQILSDLDLTSQKEGRWKRLNTLAHYNVSLIIYLDFCFLITENTFVSTLKKIYFHYKALLFWS